LVFGFWFLVSWIPFPQYRDISKKNSWSPKKQKSKTSKNVMSVSLYNGCSVTGLPEAPCTICQENLQVDEKCYGCNICKKGKNVMCEGCRNKNHIANARCPTCRAVGEEVALSSYAELHGDLPASCERGKFCKWQGPLRAFPEHECVQKMLQDAMGENARLEGENKMLQAAAPKALRVIKSGLKDGIATSLNGVFHVRRGNIIKHREDVQSVVKLPASYFVSVTKYRIYLVHEQEGTAVLLNSRTFQVDERSEEERTFDRVLAVKSPVSGVTIYASFKEIPNRVIIREFDSMLRPIFDPGYLESEYLESEGRDGFIKEVPAACQGGYAYTNESSCGYFICTGEIDLHETVRTPVRSMASNDNVVAVLTEDVLTVHYHGEEHPQDPQVFKTMVKGGTKVFVEGVIIVVLCNEDNKNYLSVYAVRHDFFAQKYYLFHSVDVQVNEAAVELKVHHVEIFHDKVYYSCTYPGLELFHMCCVNLRPEVLAVDSHDYDPGLPPYDSLLGAEPVPDEEEDADADPVGSGSGSRSNSGEPPRTRQRTE